MTALRLEGVAACTVRAVAKEAGTSAGAVHYYFTDVQEVIDVGFLQLARNYYDHIRSLAARFEDPVEALWCTIVTYITAWSGHGSMTKLWCEYCVIGIRNKQLDGVIATQQEMTDLLAEALGRVEPSLVDDADALTRFIIGTVLSQPHRPVKASDLVIEVSRLIGVPAPDSADYRCHQQGCPFHSHSPQAEHQSA